MPVIDLSSEHSVLGNFVSELRNVDIQHDPLRFRSNLMRIGEIMAYEISKKLRYKKMATTTPLGTHDSWLLADRLVLGTILRAGLPLHTGFLNFFDRAENAFVSAYRKYKGQEQFEIQIEYISSPQIKGKTLLLVDPMLATGTSFELAFKALTSKGMPERAHFACIIASETGVDFMRKMLDLESNYLWCCAIDKELDSKSYIVPGLGDAGDLAFGEKDSGGEC